MADTMGNAGLAQLAQLLKNVQFQQTHPAVQISATPPALPNYNSPGMNSALPSLAEYVKLRQAKAAAAQPPAPGPAVTPMNVPAASDPVVPPIPPPTAIGAAPGMGADPNQGMLATLLQRLKNPQTPGLPQQMAMGQYPV